MAVSTEHAVWFTEDAAAFLEAAGEHLAKDPVTATVVATIAQRVADAAAQGESFEKSPYIWFAVVTDPDGRVVGAAMRTAPFAPYPPYVLGMPEEAARALARGWLARGEETGGVNGARPAADVVAAEVASVIGGAVRVAKHTRLFELGSLVDPGPVPGRLRVVRDDEAELALGWIRQFFLDADQQAGREPGTGHDPEHFTLDDVKRKLSEHVLWFWVDEHDVPVHLTGANPPAFGVARVGPVYTPRELRGRGYGGAAVAEVSRLLRDRGARVTLFTDQANPTSNRLYQALGYEPVADTVELLIEASP